MHCYAFKSVRPFFTVIHTAIYCEKLHSLTVKNFCSNLIGFFQNFCNYFQHTVFSKDIEVGLKRFLIYTLEMPVGDL